MRIGDTPGSLVDDAAAAAMEACEATLEAGDASLDYVIVLVGATGTPADEDECTSAGSGFDTTERFAVELMQHAIMALKAHGVNAQVATLRGGPAS